MMHQQLLYMQQEEGVLRKMGYDTTQYVAVYRSLVTAVGRRNNLNTVNGLQIHEIRGVYFSFRT